MSKKRTSGNTRKSDVPYDPNDRDAVLSFWKGATAHRGVAESRKRLLLLTAALSCGAF
jgi:hypothetical protein